jgi:AcrR family transcriptional regulator
MDELGLALVDEAFRTLRQLMRTARAAPVEPRQRIRRSVETFVAYVRANRPHVALIARERSGGSSARRAAVRGEVRLFVSELATDLGRMPPLTTWSTDDLQMAAGLLVAAMMAGMLDVLDLPPGDVAEETALVRMLEKQLRLVVLGAAAWRSA